MTNVNHDLFLTNSVLSFVRSGFYGQAVYYGVLKQLGSNQNVEGVSEGAARSIEKLDPFFKELYQGLPAISTSWNQAETFEAIRLFDLVKAIKQELLATVEIVSKAYASPDLSSDPESVRILIAGIARVANTRAAYLDCAAALYSNLKLNELEQEAARQLNDAQNYVQISHVIFETFTKSETIDQPMYDRLRKESQLIKGDLKTLIHEATLLLNVFVKQFEYDQAEFTKTEAEPWLEAKVPATVAGYWRAYDFTPTEAVAWVQTGIIQAGLAANWKRIGFEPDVAQPWITEAFPPLAAKEWMDAGFQPSKARELIVRGITNPGDAPRGSSPPEASY